MLRNVLRDRGHMLKLDQLIHLLDRMLLDPPRCCLKKNISSFSKISFIKSKMLYDFSGYNVLEFIHSIDDKYSNVMIFTHNNSCSFLTAELGLSYIHVPTCGLLIFSE